MQDRAKAGVRIENRGSQQRKETLAADEQPARSDNTLLGVEPGRHSFTMLALYLCVGLALLLLGLVWVYAWLLGEDSSVSLDMAVSFLVFGIVGTLDAVRRWREAIREQRCRSWSWRQEFVPVFRLIAMVLFGLVVTGLLVGLLFALVQ